MGTRRVLKIVGFAAVILLALFGLIGGGLPGGLVMLGLSALLIGLTAAVVGPPRWAFIASRRLGSVVAAAGVVALAIGGSALPTTAPAPTSSKAPASASSPASQTVDEAALQVAEKALTLAETSETTNSGASGITGLLSDQATTAAVDGAPPTSALAALAAVDVKGRAAKTGYSRDQFGAAWADTDRNGCDTRNDILARDLTGETFKPATRNCVVLAGNLADPYSSRSIAFQRGATTSDDVQIDHVVALSDAWQTGAQAWDVNKRTAFANDQLNLLAVDGPLNEAKGDGDAATWLPPNMSYRCAYVARQVAVKVGYGL